MIAVTIYGVGSLHRPTVSEVAKATKQTLKTTSHPQELRKRGWVRMVGDPDTRKRRVRLTPRGEHH